MPKIKYAVLTSKLDGLQYLHEVTSTGSEGPLATHQNVDEAAMNVVEGRAR